MKTRIRGISIRGHGNVREKNDEREEWRGDHSAGKSECEGHVAADSAGGQPEEWEHQHGGVGVLRLGIRIVGGR